MYQQIKPIYECFTDLANAIVEKAADDYRRELRGKRYNDGYVARNEKKRLIAFFKGNWCNLLTNVSGEEILKRLDDEYEREKKGKRRVALSSGK